MGIKKVQKRLKRPKGLNEKFVSKMAKTENYFKNGNKLEKGRGGSPGLVVMGGDSRSEVCGFESRHHILDGHFFTYICCKNL